MKLSLSLLLSLALPCGAQSLMPTNPPAGVILAWNPSPGPGITNYNIYYGPGSGQYTNEVPAGPGTNCAVKNLIRGALYYFAATAVSSNGLESVFSTEISYTVPPLPPPPSNLRLTNITVTLSLLQSPNPAGPWAPITNLVAVASQPGYFRGLMAISNPLQPPAPAPNIALAPSAALPPLPVKVLKSPKAASK